jgi:Yip1 domain
MFKRLIDIWLKPRSATRSAIDSAGNIEIFALMSLFGMAAFLETALKEGFGEHFSTSIIFLQIVIAGPLVGIMTVYLLAFLTKVSGKLLKGKSDYNTLRKAITYSFLPSTILILLNNTLFIAFLGDDLFLEDWLNSDTLTPFGTGLAIGTIPFIIAVLIWILIISSKCIAEAQGFSAGKGFLNIIIATILMIISAIVLAFPLSLLGLSSLMF